MQLKLLVQKDKENTLSENIIKSFEENPKKAYFICSNIKDTGFKIIEDELIDTKVKATFVMGIDKKSTTRNMLEDILKCTSDVYYYSNNNIEEFNSSIYAFEYTNKAYIYISPTNTSQSSMQDDITVYTKVEYDLTKAGDKENFKEELKSVIKLFTKELFKKLDKEEIEKLVNEKEIFTTRQYNHNVQSISELLGNTKEPKKQATKEEIDDVYVSDIQIPKVDLSDINIELGDIDISNVEEVLAKPEKSQKENVKEVENVYYEVEKLQNTTKIENINEDETDEQLQDSKFDDIKFDENAILDIEGMLFSKSNIKLDLDEVKNIEKKAKENKEKKVEDEDLIQVKKVNLNNITNFIFELPSSTAKGQDKKSLKIPNYIKNIIPEFFELSEKGKNMDIDGSIYKAREIKLEIVDAKTGSKYHDRDAKITFKNGQSFISFLSDNFRNVSFNEFDIARVIKLASDTYHIEIIAKDMQEYKLWSKLCAQKFKATTRKYGMM
ncbi:MAG: hypothetical protein RSB67_03675 [Clostridia bacterium]